MKMGDSLGLGNTKVRSFLELLAQTFVIRILGPYHSNIKKRLVKSPSVLFETAACSTIYWDLNP